MSHFHKCKRYDLIDIVNDTLRYLENIFTIKNPKYIKVVYLTERHWANIKKDFY